MPKPYTLESLWNIYKAEEAAWIIKNKDYYQIKKTDLEQPTPQQKLNWFGVQLIRFDPGLASELAPDQFCDSRTADCTHWQCGKKLAALPIFQELLQLITADQKLKNLSD